MLNVAYKELRIQIYLLLQLFNCITLNIMYYILELSHNIIIIQSFLKVIKSFKL